MKDKLYYEKVTAGLMYRFARIVSGLTLEELAERVGCPHTRIVNYEAGRSFPDRERGLEVERALGLDIEAQARFLAFISEFRQILERGKLADEHDDLSVFEFPVRSAGELQGLIAERLKTLDCGDGDYSAGYCAALRNVLFTITGDEVL